MTTDVVGTRPRTVVAQNDTSLLSFCCLIPSSTRIKLIRSQYSRQKTIIMHAAIIGINGNVVAAMNTAEDVAGLSIPAASEARQQKQKLIGLCLTRS